MIRAAWCLVVLATALGHVAPAGADAAVSRKKAIWGPVFKDGVSQFEIYADLGAGIWQVTVPWHGVAPARPADPADPSDPAYRWPAEVDAAIAEGQKYGIEVMVMLIGAPPWANGGRAWNWAPSDPRGFATFAGAAARRWPAVRHWMVWSEPSKAQNFQPLDPDQGRPLKGFRTRGPQRYAQILDASYAALKQVNRSNLVIGGNTFTLGTIRPRWYIPALKLPNGRRPRMDLYGHNPFTLREPDLKQRPMPGGYADFSDLDTLSLWLDRAFKRPRARELRLFLSEFSLPTDHANFEFNFFVNRNTQARWLRRALEITRRWRRIYTFGYLGLYDDPLLPNGDQVERGLITRDGVRKPAYAAFKAG
jgi:hypothetical protein